MNGKSASDNSEPSWIRPKHPDVIKAFGPAFQIRDRRIVVKFFTTEDCKLYVFERVLSPEVEDEGLLQFFAEDEVLILPDLVYRRTRGNAR